HSTRPLHDALPISKTVQQPKSDHEVPRGSAAPNQNVIVVRPQRSRGLYIILGLFLGCLGIHNFYAGYHSRGAVQLIITLALGWLFFVGFIITAIWALYEICTVKQDATGEAMT